MYDIDGDQEEETVKGEGIVNSKEDCEKQETMENKLVKEKITRTRGLPNYLKDYDLSEDYGMYAALSTGTLPSYMPEAVRMQCQKDGKKQ